MSINQNMLYVNKPQYGICLYTEMWYMSINALPINVLDTVLFLSGGNCIWSLLSCMRQKCHLCFV